VYTDTNNNNNNKKTHNIVKSIHSSLHSEAKIFVFCKD